MFGSYGWSAVKYHSDYFMDLANAVRLPAWFVAENKDMEQVKYNEKSHFYKYLRPSQTLFSPKNRGFPATFSLKTLKIWILTFSLFLRSL